MNPKPWYLSRTIWLNLATLLVSVLPLFLATNTALLGDQVATQIGAVSMFVGGLLNIVIRYLWTSEPIA